MALTHYSARAESDLFEIATFTVETWGVRQADQYIRGLEELCGQLAAFPKMGRACDAISRGLRRMEYESHVVLFFPQEQGILIARVFHKSRNIRDEEFDEFG